MLQRVSIVIHEKRLEDESSTGFKTQTSVIFADPYHLPSERQQPHLKATKVEFATLHEHRVMSLVRLTTVSKGRKIGSCVDILMIKLVGDVHLMAGINPKNC